VDLLKRYVHVEDGDEPRTIRAKMTGQILTLDESLQETIPALLSLLDALPDDNPFLQLDPPQRRQRTLDGLKRILLRESQVKPLLLVFEDLHWIDSETQALLDSLVESLPTAQLLLLVNYRPEYQHSWGSKTYYTQVRLDPLPPASAEEFLQALLGDDPSLEPLKKVLIERTEGNPFFLEESIRTLVETQVLVGEPGAYRLVQALPTIQVPATVQAVLAARIDRLPQEEKRLLQTAAVIGNEVPLPLLQAIAEMPEESLYRGLTHLQAVEFLYETSLFPERIYTFKHALTHEVAYGSLLHERRRTLHVQIVEALEALVGDRPDDQVDLLAHHALRGEVWDKALTYYRQAGAKAMANSANREAVACFEHALDAVHHLPESRAMHELAIDLRLDLRNVLFPLDEQARILAHLRDAEALAEALNDHWRLGQIFTYMAFCYGITGDHEGAVTYGQHALAAATALGDVRLQVMANIRLGQGYFRLGDYRRAIDCLRQNVAALEGDLRHARFGMAGPPSVHSRTWLVWCLAACGEFVEGMTHGDDAMRIAEAVDHPFSIEQASSALGLLYLRKGEFRQAISLFERALELCRLWNFPFQVLDITARLAYAYALSGQVVTALPLLEQAVEQGASTRTRGSGYTFWFTWLSETYLLAGRLAEAGTWAGRALQLSRERKERGSHARTLRLLGDIAMHHDPPEIDQAETHYHQALALANELGMRPLQAHCHRGLGTLYSQTGQAEQACAELSTAIELYRDMEMTFWLPETEAALAEVEGKA
jgi:tetratricopeptide (TPR) repeat protein